MSLQLSEVQTILWNIVIASNCMVTACKLGMIWGWKQYVLSTTDPSSLTNAPSLAWDGSGVNRLNPPYCSRHPWHAQSTERRGSFKRAWLELRLMGLGQEKPRGTPLSSVSYWNSFTSTPTFTLGDKHVCLKYTLYIPWNSFSVNGSLMKTDTIDVLYIH